MTRISRYIYQPITPTVCILDMRSPRLRNICHRLHLVNYWQWNIYSFTAPILRLPMDEIQGTTIKGSILGRIVGGSSLVQGKLGYALSTNGINQAIDFGRHLDKCFHIPDACGAGSTFSYWLKWKSVSGHSLIMDSGGYYGNTRGYAHNLVSHGVMAVSVKDSSYYYGLRASIGEPDKWVLIIQTWSPSSGIKLYVNGCTVVDTLTGRSNRTHRVVRRLKFVIGSNSANFRRCVAMEMDNFLAWEEELTEDEAWRLYVQGGQV